MNINHLHVGQVFMITLDGNPTTGYEWEYKMVPDTSIISIQGEYIPANVGPGIVGSGGKYVYKGKALAPGTVSIIFSYSRPWETVPPVDTKIYNFVISS